MNDGHFSSTFFFFATFYMYRNFIYLTQIHLKYWSGYCYILKLFTLETKLLLILIFYSNENQHLYRLWYVLCVVSRLIWLSEKIWPVCILIGIYIYHFVSRPLGIGALPICVEKCKKRCQCVRNSIPILILLNYFLRVRLRLDSKITVLILLEKISRINQKILENRRTINFYKYCVLSLAFALCCGHTKRNKKKCICWVKCNSFCLCRRKLLIY